MIRLSEVMRGQWFVLWLLQLTTLIAILNSNKWVVWSFIFLFLWRIYRSQVSKLISIAFLCLFLTISSWVIHSHYLQPINFDQMEQEFVVTIDPFRFKKREWGYTGIGSLHYPVKRNVLINLPLNEQVDNFIFQDNQIKIYGTGALQSFLGPDNFGAFNAKNYYLSRNIVEQLKFKELKEIKPLETSKLKKWRNRWYRYLERMPYQEARNYLQALLFNSTTNLSGDLKDSFKKLGLMPFLALSGFHIQLLVKYLKSILYRTSLSIETSRWLISLLLVCYGFVTGWPISLLRSVGLYLCGEWGRKNYTSLDYLSGLGIIFLVIRPALILSISFQLSFGMTALILLVNECLKIQREKNSMKWSHQVAAQISFMLAAFIGTAYYFFEINLGLVLWNVLMAYFLEWVLLPILFTFLLYNLCSFATPWYQQIDQILSQFNELFTTLANQNKLSVIVGQLSPLLLLVVIILLVGLIQTIRQDRFGLPRFLIYSFIIMVFLFLPRFSPKQSVVFLNVGQGDAMLVYTPFKRFVALVDTGGRITFKNGRVEKDLMHTERVLLPALKREGISRIDYLILSHPDFDHMGNALELIKTLPVSTVLVAEQSLDDPSYKALNQWRVAKGESALIGIQSGAYLADHSLSLQLLAPIHKNTSDDKNEDSLVWLMETKQERFMLTGDASKEVEAMIVRTYQESINHLKVDTLKVGHHGSNTSTSEEFLKHLKPRRAIISSGLNNRYRHPHEEVIERLTTNQVNILDTRVEGAIRYDEYIFNWISPSWKTSR